MTHRQHYGVNMKSLVLALTSTILCACAIAQPVPPMPAAGSFALIGDTPYGTTTEPQFDRVIDAINAAPDFPDMLQEVARARELDQFASDHDAQLSFMLRARHAAWSPGYVQQNAARVGFVVGAMPGRLVLPASAPGLPPVLTLGYDTQAALAEDPDQSAIRDITLSLDVAQVHRSEQPFARLREVAAALCEAMDGVLCDQNGTPLPAMAMDPIAADLELLYDQLDQRDLSAGSVLARRLFS